MNSLIIPFCARWVADQHLQASCSGAAVQFSNATGLRRNYKQASVMLKTQFKTNLR